MPAYALTVVAMAAVLAAPALACPGLEPTAKPYLGELNFSAQHGLTNLAMSGRAGGSFNLRDCGLEGEGLAGYRGDGLVRVRPDLLVHWDGDATELIIGAEFAEPILLLIRDPEGRWLFDDGLGHDPVVTITAPRAGDYAVYMGSHGTAAFTKPGTLIISETRP